MNKTILIGNLAKDPEFSTTPSGLSVCKFNLAVSRGYGEKKETDFLPIVCWRKTAELARDYTQKGSKVAITGSIQTRNYEAKDGTTRYITEIVADDIEFLSSKTERNDITAEITPTHDNLPF